MAAITTDNAIIDYNTITNIVNTLNTHEDVFTAFQQQALVVSADKTSSNPINNLLVSGTQIACVRVQIPAGFTGKAVYLNQAFSNPPIISIAVETSSTTAVYVPQFSFQANAANSSYNIINVSVVNPLRTYDTTPVVLHITAIGQKQ